MQLVEVKIESVVEEKGEMIASELIQSGAESMWFDDGTLHVYYHQGALSDECIEHVLTKYEIKGRNYSIHNADASSWEEKDVENFYIAEQVHISNDFNSLKGKYLHELYILTKQSFGSGDHPSTVLCIEILLDLNIKDLAIADVGTGSGILAIFAKKLGAQHVCAFDNNPWAIEVAKENIEGNGCNQIELSTLDLSDENVDVKFDFVIANLNESVLKMEGEKLNKLVKKDGFILVSGFQQKDEDQIHKVLFDDEIKLVQRKTKDKWVALLIKHTIS